MKHLPYGYKIADGQVVIDEPKANQVKELFARYLNGESFASASKNTNLNLTHSQISRMLEKVAYLGDDFYPCIITEEVFERAKDERLKRATRLGRLNKVKPEILELFSVDFKMNKPTKMFKNPFEQAEYLYSLIEMVVVNNDS